MKERKQLTCEAHFTN